MLSVEKDLEYGARVRALREKSVYKVVLQLDRIQSSVTSTDKSSVIDRTPRRLLSELKMITEDPKASEYAWLLPNHGSNHLLAVIQGPAGTPYEGGLFWVLHIYPADYPLKPPIMRMITKVFHPNIDEHGNICAGMLSFDWCSVYHIQSLLVSLATIVGMPRLDDPLVPDIAAMYLNNYKEYERVAREWTAKYTQAEAVQRSDLRYV